MKPWPSTTENIGYACGSHYRLEHFNEDGHAAEKGSSQASMKPWPNTTEDPVVLA